MKTALVSLLVCLALLPVARAADKKVIFLPGAPSHGAGEHEHRAALLLFQKCLAGFPGLKIEVHDTAMGWVEDEKVFDDAAAIVMYSSGAGGHPLLKNARLEKMGQLMKKGVGLGLIHYAIEPTREKGQNEFIAWLGGAFETYYSVNPVFEGEFKSLPVHPVTRGVKPFSTRDEWYYQLRFREGMQGVTPILTLVPPMSSLNRPNPPKPDDAPRLREGNPTVYAAVARQEPQHVMWVTERADGGRGFGFAGGHYHTGWANPEQRKVVLNAIVWLAKLEVPANGIVSTPSSEDLSANLDPKGRRGGAPASAGAPQNPAPGTPTPK